MDTKQAQINTFTDGLNTDLHPLTTPNTMLTDCINGTVITYNGNEYILQNDMGNYVLEKAKLWADYIPVGIKEYGNIIYIVSYNPIDKKCQIGSYPSPQTLFDNADYGSKNENYQGVQVYTLDPKWTWPTDPKWILSDGIVNSSNTSKDPIGESHKEVLFTNTKPNQNIRIFFPESADIKETFLNPGDKYYLKKEDNEDSHWKFQKCEYYTLTESKEAYKLEDGQVISEPHDYAPERLKNVTWEVPGWLGYKPSLIEPSSFDLYLTDIKIPSFLTNKSTLKEADPSSAILSFDVQGQLTISTIDDWRGQYDKLKVYFDYKFADKNWSNIFEKETESGDINNNWISSEEKGNPTNYGNTIDILTFNTSKKLFIKKSDIDTNKTIIIRATPYIIDESDNSGIVYDNITVTYTINLGDLYNIRDIEALTIYKYLSDDDGVTINFNIISPTSNLKQITCKYRIHEIQDKFTGVARNTGYKDIDSLNLLGQNILTLDYDKEDGWFHKEEIYIFELAFFDIDDWNNNQNCTPIYQVAEFLITSSVLNDFYIDKDQYQKITLREWTSNIKKYITVDKSVQIGNIKDTQSYCKYVKVYNPKSVFKSSFYSNSENAWWPINSPEDPSGDFSSEEVTNLKNEAITSIFEKESNISNAGYYGSLGSYISKLEVNIPMPSIIKNSGLWGNMEWNTNVTYNVKNTITDTILESPFVSKTIILTNEDSVKEDDSIELVYINSIFNLYNTKAYSGKIYDKWYLYRNLSPLNEICSNWIDETIKENKGSWLTTELKTVLTKLKKLINNSGIVAKDSRKAITYLQSTYSGNRRKLYLLLKNSKQYNFNSFTINGHYFDNDGDVLSKDWPNITDFDNYFSRRLTSNETMIPIYYDTNNRGGNDHGGDYDEERIWTFPDKPTSWHWSGACRGSASFALLCKDGATVSVAVIRPFKEYESGFKGTFYTGSAGPQKTQFLVSSVNYNSDDISDYVSNNMLRNFAMFLLALGIQIYGVYNIREGMKTYIVSTEQTEIYNSSNKYTISYKRDDTLNKLTYKLINFFSNNDISSIEKNKDNFINSIIKYSTYKINFSNILQDGYVKPKITTNSNSIDYYFEKSVSDLGIVHTTFINEINGKLNTVVNAFTSSQSYNENTVICDLDNDTQISRYFKGLASNFTFEFKNNKGYIYYNGLPENTFGGRYDDHYFDNIRWLDWSTIPWEHLKQAFVLTNDFEKAELTL